ncbi:MAG: hypothetical protein NVS3B25_25820 [Hymenobacter sp.]
MPMDVAPGGVASAAIRAFRNSAGPGIYYKSSKILAKGAPLPLPRGWGGRGLHGFTIFVL